MRVDVVAPMDRFQHNVAPQRRDIMVNPTRQIIQAKGAEMTALHQQIRRLRSEVRGAP
jgi:hypothetical protein